MNKKGLSPLAATMLLLVFGLFLGIVVMSLQSAMITHIGGDTLRDGGTLVCFDPSVIDDPLKLVQLQYMKGEITKEEYDTKVSAISES